MLAPCEREPAPECQNHNQLAIHRRDGRVRLRSVVSRMALPGDGMKCVRAVGVALHDEASEAQCQAEGDQIQVTYPHTNRS